MVHYRAVDSRRESIGVIIAKKTYSKAARFCMDVLFCRTEFLVEYRRKLSASILADAVRSIAPWPWWLFNIALSIEAIRERLMAKYLPKQWKWPDRDFDDSQLHIDDWGVRISRDSTGQSSRGVIERVVTNSWWLPDIASAAPQWAIGMDSAGYLRDKKCMPSFHRDIVFLAKLS